MLSFYRFDDAKVQNVPDPQKGKCAKVRGKSLLKLKIKNERCKNERWEDEIGNKKIVMLLSLFF